jgi:MoaA/NifB/PqqE/SkfB family radical SAM enzyme
MDDKPRVMIFPVTMTCNSRCKSCGIWKLPAPEKAHSDRKLLDIILSDEYLRTNVESINLSGGEPFHHPEITPFVVSLIAGYRRLKEICINTDGHLIEEIVSMLDIALPLCTDRGIVMRIYVSLDGIGERHDIHRRHPGAFVFVDRILRRLSEMKSMWPMSLRATASFTITEGNVDEIVPVFSYVRGLGLRVDYTLAARPEVFIGGAGLEKRFQVTPEQIEIVRAAIREVCTEPQYSNYSEAYYATMLETLSSGHRTRGCFYPSRGFVLMPDGKVYICGTYRDFFFGNLYDVDFETMWNGALRAGVRGEKIPRKCANCFASSYEDWEVSVGARV